MAGISSKALNFGGYGSSGSGDCGCPNKKGFNGNEIQNREFSDGSGLEVYDFNARSYDQQIGRFIQIDPIPNEGEQESLSPYHFGGNNPILYNDPDGKCPWCIPFLIGWLTSESVVTVVAVTTIAAGTTVAGMAAVEAIQNSDISLPAATGTGTARVASGGTAAQQDFAVERQLAKARSTPEKTQAAAETGSLAKGAKMLAKAADKNTGTTTKKDRVANQKSGENAQNQLEGIEKKQAKEKKNAASQGEKQNKINSTKKSEQNLNKELKNIKSLKDAQDNF